MLTAITIAGHASAQSVKLCDLVDGRVTISDGVLRLTGWPVERMLRGALSAIAVAMLSFGAPAARAEPLLNVSYDPTREFYKAFDEAFAKHWEALGNAAPEIETSHGGSGAQARTVIDGLAAQVVTLALASDIDKTDKAGKLPMSLASARLPHNSGP